MAQIKIYGLDTQLNPIKQQLSQTIHSCIVEALQMPKDKKFHRFFPMRAEDMFYPNSRTNAYTIIEITMIEGRSKEAKKKLISLLFKQIKSEVGIEVEDTEILIQEAPAHHFGFRGISGDEILLDYKVEV